MFTTPITQTRKSVLSLAWELVRKAGLSFSAAQKQAWAAIKLKVAMAIKPQSFFFKKDDGSERFAVGYYGAVNDPSTLDLTTTVKGLCVKYYDTLAGGWRSFRADRLILA